MIPLDKLVAHALGDLPASEAAQIERILSSDSSSARSMAEVRRLVGDLRRWPDQEALFSVNPEQRRALISLFGGRGEEAAQPGLEAAIRSIRRLATLLFDSSRATAAAFRGQATQRHVVYGFDGGTIDLQVQARTAESAGIELVGHVESETEAFEVIARAGGGPEVIARIGEDGFFECQLPEGPVHLLIVMDGIEVDVPELDPNA